MAEITGVSQGQVISGTIPMARVTVENTNKVAGASLVICNGRTTISIMSITRPPGSLGMEGLPGYLSQASMQRRVALDTSAGTRFLDLINLHAQTNL